MREAYLHASLSKDPRTKIGAVLIQEDSIISTGFNGFPRKVFDYEDRYLDKEIKYQFICHAEANAVTAAARLGNRTNRATLVTQGIPCAECCKTLIQAGIKAFVTHKQWPNLTHSPKWVESIEITKQMMAEAEIRHYVVDKVLGCAGFLDGKEIQV